MMKRISVKRKKRKRINCINLICWIIIPVCMIVMFVLDGFGIYPFNKERLIVMGIGILVVLIPFFSEVTIKNISIKKNNGDK